MIFRNILRVRDGRIAESAATDEVAVEAPLELRLAGKSLTVLMRTPGEDDELVLGFLYTEGMIQRATDVRAMKRPENLVGDEVGNVLDVALDAAIAPRPMERLFYASSSCGVCGKNSISSLAIHAPAVESRVRVGRGLLSELPRKLSSAQPQFAATGGLHASGLFDTLGNLIVAREDVGRHNALDKVIGWALSNERVPLADTILVVSGRVSYEIVQKAVAAGLGVIAAVGAPSSLAIDLAEQFNVTLAGFVRGTSMNVYTHRERVTATG